MSGSEQASFLLRLAGMNLERGDAEAALTCVERALDRSPTEAERAQAADLAERVVAQGGAPADPLVARARYLAARAQGLVEAKPLAAEAGAGPAPPAGGASETLDAVRTLLASSGLIEAPPSAELTLPALDVVSALLGTELDVAGTARLALDLVARATGADRAHLLLSDAGESAFGLPGAEPRPPEVSRGVAAEAARTRRSVVVSDGLQDERFKERASVQELEVRSALAVPLLDPGRGDAPPIGTLYLEADRPGRFGGAAVRLAEALAALVAPPLRNAARYQEEQQARARAERLYAQARDADLRERGGPRILGDSPQVRQLQALIDRVAPGEHTVLIEGESGTGKELVARALHARSARAEGPFVAENMAALAEGLREAELFGHAKGAYTGADVARPGLFQLASGGTLFLDEVGEMDADLQAKLLRVLEQREVRPVGSEGTVKVDARIVAATHRDLAAEVREGRFREDLYYRLTVIKLRVPPLRERRGDVPLLLEHFLGRSAADLGAPPPPVSPELLRRLEAYPWPGNVRELQAYATRLVLTGPEEAELADGAPPGQAASGEDERLGLELRLPSDALLELREARNLFDKTYLALVLQRQGGNVSAAARALGLNRSYCSELVKRYGLKG